MTLPTRATAFPNLSPPLYVGRVLAPAGPGEYTFVEAWLGAAGGFADKAGGRYGGAKNLGVALDGVAFAPGDYCLVRPAAARAGLNSELLPLGAGNGTSTAAGECGPVWLRALRPSDCVRLTVGTGEDAPTATLRYDPASRLWVTADDEPLTICGTDFRGELDPLTEELTLTAPTENENCPPLRLTARAGPCGGCASASFVFGKARVCPCSSRSGDICDDVVTVRAEPVTCGALVDAATCFGADFGPSGDGRAPEHVYFTIFGEPAELTFNPFGVGLGGVLV